LSKNFYF